MRCIANVVTSLEVIVVQIQIVVIHVEILHASALNVEVKRKIILMGILVDYRPIFHRMEGREYE